MRGLDAASALVLVRYLVRVVQYFQKYEGYINSHEVFPYVFDTVPMFAVMQFMLLIHAPTSFQQGRGDGTP